jgi:hypothetical protein
MITFQASAQLTATLRRRSARSRARSGRQRPTDLVRAGVPGRSSSRFSLSDGEFWPWRRGCPSPRSRARPNHLRGLFIGLHAMPGQAVCDGHGRNSTESTGVRAFRVVPHRHRSGPRRVALTVPHRCFTRRVGWPSWESSVNPETRCGPPWWQGSSGSVWCSSSASAARCGSHLTITTRVPCR